MWNIKVQWKRLRGKLAELEGDYLAEARLGCQLIEATDNPVTVCPWNHVLKYHDNDEEEKFVSSFSSAVPVVDFVSAILPLFLTPVKIATTAATNKIGFRISTAVAFVVIPMIMLTFMIFYPQFYRKRRSTLAAIGRPIIAAGCALSLIFEDPWPTTSSSQLFGSIVSKTPIVPLITTTFGMRLPFYEHIKIGVCYPKSPCENLIPRVSSGWNNPAMWQLLMLVGWFILSSVVWLVGS